MSRDEDCPESDIGHNWVAGMMYVSNEDIEQVARARQAAGESAPECEYCEATYVLD